MACKEGCRQNDVEEEGILQEEDLERDLWGKEMTTEFGVSFI